MKFFIGSLLVKILDKMNFTVVIGCRVKGDITCKRDNQYFYSNDFSKAKTFHENGQEFELPEGKFKIKSEYNKDSNKYIVWYTKIINKTKS